MADFDSIQQIVEKNNIKLKTVAVFGLDELLKQAEHYTVPTLLPEHLVHLPDISFEEQDGNFCSIFSDQAETSMATQITQEHSMNTKLRSEGAILSSEFDQEVPEAILTSDKLRE